MLFYSYFLVSTKLNVLLTNSCWYLQLEKEIDQQINEWEAEHGCVFLVDGVRFIDYVQNQWEEHRIAQETEKMERVSSKSNWELFSLNNSWSVVHMTET